MLWSWKLAFLISGACAVSLCAAGVNDAALWTEYGLVNKSVVQSGKQTVTAYRMKDLTGALAAWEWLRSSEARPCQLAAFCTQEKERTVISDANYVLTFEPGAPTPAEVKATLDGLPNKRSSSLPPILTFLPESGRVPDSGRYLLGPVSLKAFAPELAGAKTGFEEGAEAQVARYRIGKSSETPLSLAIFDYPTPEMARQHTVNFKSSVGPHVKRSGVLVAVVYGSAADTEAETLLSRVQYEAKITWNDVPPPGPIKPLYRLLVDILYISVLLSLLALGAGLVYAGMRIYRRRYGTLDSEEAMTTLNLSGD